MARTLSGAFDQTNPAWAVGRSPRMVQSVLSLPVSLYAFRTVEVRVHGVRQDVPPRLERIDYEIIVDTDEPNRRLELLHDNVKKYGTVFNTVAPGTTMAGVLRRR